MMTTITHQARPCAEMLKGFEEVKPMVFAGIYPLDNDDFEDLRDSLEKLQLNDASLVFEPETSAALGLGSSATLADIKKSFRQKASQYHPDRNTDAHAPARFRAVQEAYEVLTDDAKRQAYDDNRRRNLLDDPAQTAREIWQAYFEPLRQTAR